jgi:serine/threonine-protein kinase RsbW
MEFPSAVVCRNQQGEPSVELRGDVDFNNAHVLRDAATLAARLPGEAAIIMDLGAVSFIDSSGLSALVAAARELHASGRWLRLERASPHLVRLLQTAGFSHFFEVKSQLAPNGLPPGRDGSRGKVWQHASFRVPARPQLLSHIRGRVAAMVEGVPVADDCMDNIRLAVGEAASNAFRHGCAGSEVVHVRVTASTDGQTLVVEITDPGPGFDPDAVPIPDPCELQEGGLGIRFMKLTMDEVTYRFEGGTTVRLVKRLSSPANGSAADLAPGPE